MGVAVVTSAASHHRIVCGQDWLQAHQPAEEVRIIGPTLLAANEVARILLRADALSRSIQL
jgi:hypothetical protein